jgi:hypothetical protein
MTGIFSPYASVRPIKFELYDPIFWIEGRSGMPSIIATVILLNSLPWEPGFGSAQPLVFERWAIKLR